MAQAHRTRYFSDTNISQGSAATRLRRSGTFNRLMITLMQISGSLQQRKNFKNRPVFDEVKLNIRQAFFSGHGVYGKNIGWTELRWLAAQCHSRPPCP